MLTERGQGFVEVNSTLIVYLCPKGQSAGVRTGCVFLCAGSCLQHIESERTVKM